MAKRGSTRRRAKGSAKQPPTTGAFYRPFAHLEPVPTRSEKAPAPPPQARVHVHEEENEPPASDAETFAVYMAGVRTLAEKSSTRVPLSSSPLPQSAKAATAADPDGPARLRMAALITEGIRFEVSDDGMRVEGRRMDVDPREVRRLRRGQYAIDGRLDLHGMNAEEARQAVEVFVRQRRAAGDRVVVIVHGKGNHSPRGIGVLRGEIGAWLSQGRASREVAAFSSGEVRVDEPVAGAVYVLLAR